MREFIIDFLKILSNCVLVICFAFSAFLLIINIYHYEDVKYKYDVNIEEDVRYEEYKVSLAKTDKKMKSVSTDGSKYFQYGRVIGDYYDSCSKKINDSSYNNLKDDNIGIVDIYKFNSEILNDLNLSCLVSISSFIEESSEEVDFKYNPSTMIEIVGDKRDLIQLNAQSLIDSGLANSSYSFSTDVFKGTIYNKNRSDFNLTIKNYTLIASVLEDIADWYVLEFGGNN